MSEDKCDKRMKDMDKCECESPKPQHIDMGDTDIKKINKIVIHCDDNKQIVIQPYDTIDCNKCRKQAQLEELKIISQIMQDVYHRNQELMVSFDYDDIKDALIERMKEIEK